MVAILCDNINCHQVWKYDNILIFEELYTKTRNVSYYLIKQYHVISLFKF